MRPAEVTGYSPLAGQTELDDVVVPAWIAELAGRCGATVAAASPTGSARASAI